MVNYTKPEMEITEFEITDVLTLSYPGNNGWLGENGAEWY